jgi:signal transduction histidine kinase
MESPEMESLFAPFAFPSRIPYIYRRKPNPPALNAFRRFIKTIPAWAFALVTLVIMINTIYLIFRYKTPAMHGDNGIFENGQFIITDIKTGSAADIAGLNAGDIVISINSIPYTENYYLYHRHENRAGKTLVYLVQRNNEELAIPLVLVSSLTEIPDFFQSMYVLILLLSIGSLYILYRKPADPAARLFFIYFQLYAIMQNAKQLIYQDPFATFSNIGFLFGSCLGVAALIHFHLLFPAPSQIYSRYKRLPFYFYGIGFILALFYSKAYILYIYVPSWKHVENFTIIDRLVVLWMTIAFFIALGIVVYQYITIKSTLARNQLRLVMLGSLFGLITPITLALFYDYIVMIQNSYPFILEYSAGIGGLIMIICLLIAIFHYRIWGMEIFIRKALLYLGATIIITSSYFVIIFLVNQMTEGGSDIFRFLSLAVSVIIFLVLRDRMQRLIDRLFHRESYDTATVVSSFEEKLAGIYRFEELKSGIARGLDEIFHFKSLVFILKKDELTYEPVYSLGQDQTQSGREYKVTPELEKRLQKSRVFSPAEFDQKLPVPELANGELIVPLIKEDRPIGFFLCGPKKSEKTYSLQDIRVLSLIAKRVIALFNTASLYQKDLDRQLMLERERARISQDMHDDVGASLTRISMMSELVKNMTGIREDARQWLGQISGTSRGVMEEMNQIIWALNPKNDNLEGLVTYIRRFAFEYLEPTPLECVFELPAEIPDLALSVEVRRNVYLVVREALHNVVKHSGAKKVQISLLMKEHGFRILIKDNGHGFDPDKLEFPGNGLVNMKKRMNDIGGEIVIRSIVGEGTEIELIMVM